MRTIAFYAFKGGTGRTLALMHAGWYLARTGRRVVVIDLDLAAPGIWPLLSQNEPPEGFVELAADWLEGRARPVRDYLHEVPLDSQATGSMFVLAAGRMDRRYLETLQSLDWQKLLDERQIPSGEEQLSLFDGRQRFFDHLRHGLEEEVQPDAVFIDAPTGFSEAANITLRVLADLVVVLFGPTRQQLGGVGRIVATLTEDQARRRQLGGAARPEVLCVASALMSRRPTGAVHKRLEEAHSFLDKVRFEALGNPEVTEEIADSVEQQRAVISYEPTLADLDGLDFSSMPDEAQFAVYEDVLRFVAEAVPRPPRKSAAPPIDPDQKRIALTEAQSVFEQFAEREPEKLEQYFLRAEHIDRLRDPMSVVVLGGKGAGKTALFLYATRNRHEGNVEHVRVHEAGRALMSPDAFVALERGNVGFDVLWRVYALAQTGVDVALVSPIASNAVLALSGLLRGTTEPQEAFGLLTAPELPLHVDRAWQALDNSLAKEGRSITLYFDGLDTVTKGDLDARDRALRGLFSAWQFGLSKLDRVSTKVFVRTDLWEQLSFPEKSHLRARTMRLVWRQPELWRLVLKRVLHAPTFVQIAAARDLPALSAALAETTSMEAAHAYLDVLFEARIWTGKNSLARNWILRRLQDANSVIFPRDLLCLLQQAAIEEVGRIQEHARVAKGAVLSRESLQRALIPTSQQRVDAVREEYPELAALLASLNGVNANGQLEELKKQVDRVPSQLVENTIEALRGAGVLGVDGDEYKVPALYHYGLNMIRPGPT